MGVSLNPLTKIISITSPTTSVTIQGLVDVIRDWEDELCNMTYNKVIDAVGKADLGGGVTTGIVVSMNTDWQIQFWQGSGVTKVSGGTIVGGVGDEPVKATGAAGDLTILQNPVNSTIVSAAGAGDWTLPERSQIRDALGVDGSKSGAAGGQIQEIQTDITNLEDKTKYILGLVQSNFRMKDQIYDGNKRLTSAKIRIYNNAIDCGNDNNFIKEYSINASYNGDGNLINYFVVEI